jgi:hypothetical protein
MGINMKRNDNENPDIKITTTKKDNPTDVIQTDEGKFLDYSALVCRAGYEPQTKCSPDNNDFFEERSNPLSSKGN